MRQTPLLQKLFVRSQFVLARRGHGGPAQAQKELERLALLEQSMLQPATVRAEQTPAVTHAAAAAYLRELPNRVECVRAAAVSQGAEDTPYASSSKLSREQAEAEEAGPHVSNLTQFLSRCKQLKIEYSSAGDSATRRLGREKLCAFWTRHASSAISCCYQGVREVGFVADYGLADTGMHLGLSELWAMLRVLKAESGVASGVDATRILQYLSRELQYLERGRPAASHKRDTNPVAVAERPAPSNLLAFRQALTDLALDLLAFYFVVHNPSVDPPSPHMDTHRFTTFEEGGSNQAHLAPSPAPPLSNVPIASAIDALSGLEVLAVLSAADATDETIAKVWEQRRVSTLRCQREPAVVAAAATAQARTASLAREVHYLLVAELFRFLAMQRHDLRLTDIVHGFALLRVHLQTLWPPYARDRHNSGDNALISITAAVSTDTPAAAAPTRAPHLPLWYEKDTLFRVTWGLAVGLVSKDRRLVNPYHYVKIVTALAKLPGFVLAPAPEPPKELRRYELSSKTDSAGTAIAEVGNSEHHNDHFSLLSEIPPEQRARHQPPEVEESKKSNNDKDEAAVVALRPADFWRFIVSKACVFVPSLPLDQRHVVCRSLHLAITEKRGQLLRNSTEKMLRNSPNTSSRSRRGATSKFWGIAARGHGESSDDAADIILPLVEEMATYAENYNACIQDRCINRHHHTTNGKRN